MRELKFKVKGMMCEGCENRIKNSLKNVNGVENVDANHRDGEVRVTLNKDVAISFLKERIEDVGFDIEE